VLALSAAVHALDAYATDSRQAVLDRRRPCVVERNEDTTMTLSAKNSVKFFIVLGLLLGLIVFLRVVL
jgi:hypothetical protein